MPSRAKTAMYNTPAIRNGGFGALQVEALTNRPLSIARRHLAASQLRMQEIEPDELSSSEWVRFLAMEEMERNRWITIFLRRRRNSAESNASTASSSTQAQSKAEEARTEAEAVSRPEQSSRSAVPTGSTPSVSLWVRSLDTPSANQFTARRPMHARRAATTGYEAPPAYDASNRPSTPPPAYAPRT